VTVPRGGTATTADIAALVETLVRWVEPVFGGAGYYIIASAVLMERSIFVGLLVPGDVILALGGVFAAKGDLNLVVVILIGTFAAIAGESIGFAIGRRYGFAVVRRIPLVRRLEPKLHEAEKLFQKCGGGVTVAVGRYATAAGAFVPFTAGTARMPYRRFLLWDVPAIAVWATGISIFGFVFGENLPFVDRALSRFGYIVLGLVVAYVAGRWLWKHIRARAKDRSQT
jgi:membrane-associated protein